MKSRYLEIWQYHFCPRSKYYGVIILRQNTYQLRMSAPWEIRTNLAQTMNGMYLIPWGQWPELKWWPTWGERPSLTISQSPGTAQTAGRLPAIGAWQGNAIGPWKMVGIPTCNMGPWCSLHWMHALLSPNLYSKLEIVDQWSTRIPPPDRRGWHCSKSQGSYFESNIADNR